MSEIILGVCSSISIYKSLDLIRLLDKENIKVNVVMTANATKLIKPITFSSISGKEVHYKLFKKDMIGIEHIKLARQSDLLVIAPATANVIGKLANGIADDLLTTIALAFDKEVLIAPAMNTHMLNNIFVQENLNKLKRAGMTIIEPEEGLLACGEEGIGKLASPEKIYTYVKNSLKKRKTLEGKRVLISAGPTVEKIDLVRFISNFSSGKMGYAIAGEAVKRKGEVTLVSGPTNIPIPLGVSFQKVLSAEEMKNAIIEKFNNIDILIMAAAVADYKPHKYNEKKIKKSDKPLHLTLIPTSDILLEVSKIKRNQLVIGFSAEEGFNLQRAEKKMKEKRLDAILLNDISDSTIGFNVDDNRIYWIDRKGNQEDSGIQSKIELARWIWDRIINFLL